MLNYQTRSKRGSPTVKPDAGSAPSETPLADSPHAPASVASCREAPTRELHPFCKLAQLKLPDHHFAFEFLQIQRFLLPFFFPRIRSLSAAQAHTPPPRNGCFTPHVEPCQIIRQPRRRLRRHPRSPQVPARTAFRLSDAMSPRRGQSLDPLLLLLRSCGHIRLTHGEGLPAACHTQFTLRGRFLRHRHRLQVCAPATRFALARRGGHRSTPSGGSARALQPQPGPSSPAQTGNRRAN